MQLVPMRERAADAGWTLVEYVDQASAADLAGRRAWKRLLEDARAGKLDRLLTWSLDRAFRSSLHCLATLEELEHLGVGFQCTSQPGIDTTSATGRLTLQVLAAVAEFERALIRARVKEGMANARRKGASFGRPSVTERPGFGAEWKSVKAEMDAGRLPQRAAARRLNIGVATLHRLLLSVPKRRGRRPSS